MLPPVFAMQVAMNPENTVFDAKRLIGRKFADDAVQSDMKHWCAATHALTQTTSFCTLAHTEPGGRDEGEE
jgi:molecular chaperone DnaK (HSP70)